MHQVFCSGQYSVEDCPSHGFAVDATRTGSGRSRRASRATFKRVCSGATATNSEAVCSVSLPRDSVRCVWRERNVFIAQQRTPNRSSKISSGHTTDVNCASGVSWRTRTKRAMHNDRRLGTSRCVILPQRNATSLSSCSRHRASFVQRVKRSSRVRESAFSPNSLARESHQK